MTLDASPSMTSLIALGKMILAIFGEATSRIESIGRSTAGVLPCTRPDAVGEGVRPAHDLLRRWEEQAGPADRFGNVLIRTLSELNEQVPTRTQVFLVQSEKQTQFRISGPGGVHTRVGINRRSPTVRRHWASSEPKLNAPDGRLYLPDGRGPVGSPAGSDREPRSGGPWSPERCRDRNGAQGIVGVELEGLLKADDRLIQATLSLQGEAPGCCASWHNWERA